jgi:glycosyltransferase involved in cell wall biosynthesis
MARILFLSELLPYPLVSGAKIRAYYVLRHLAQEHRITLLSFVREDDRPEDVAQLASFLDEVRTVPMRRSWLRNARAVCASLCTGQPALIAREEIGAMRRRVEEQLAQGRYDVLHADQIPMARYGLLQEATGPRRLLDQHNATFQLVRRLANRQSSGWKRRLLLREARAFARYEVSMCHRFDHVTFVSHRDRQALSAEMGAPARESAWSVIPICVDTEAKKPVLPVASPLRVTVLGTMYWPPNADGFWWFWEQVWPHVQRQVPRARLTCIGKNPPSRIRALHGQANVEVLGYVEDLAPLLAETSVFVVPLQAAGGMRVKILDAWCWGVPVVSTAMGAEDLAIQDGKNILIADTPQAFAAAVIRVFTRTEISARLRVAGRRWVEKRYDWRRVYRAWEPVYERLLRQPARRRAP